MDKTRNAVDGLAMCFEGDQRTSFEFVMKDEWGQMKTSGE